MYHDTDVHIGGRIRARRVEMGLSQTGLADKLGITFQQVQKYESGANRISGSRLWEACNALDVEPNYFFHGLGGMVAEGSTPKPAASERMRLTLFQAFNEISDNEIRRQIVSLTQALAKQSGSASAGETR